MSSIPRRSAFPVLYSSFFLLCSTWWVGDFITAIKVIPLSFGEEINLACDTPICRSVVPLKKCSNHLNNLPILYISWKFFEMTHILTCG